MKTIYEDDLNIQIQKFKDLIVSENLRVIMQIYESIVQSKEK